MPDLSAEALAKGGSRSNYRFRAPSGDWFYRNAVKAMGSIANIIVLDQARQLGLRVGWREHARVGVPRPGVGLALVQGRVERVT